MPGMVESPFKATALRKCGDSVASMISISIILKMYGVHRIRSTCKTCSLVVWQMSSAKLEKFDNGVKVKKILYH